MQGEPLWKTNLLTFDEKESGMLDLRQEIANGQIDPEIIFYLERINAFPFIMTTGSCTGHGVEDKHHPWMNFRSGFSERDTIIRLLKPMDIKFPINIRVQLIWPVTDEKLQYRFQLCDVFWRDQLEHFIVLLESVETEMKKEPLWKTDPKTWASRILDLLLEIQSGISEEGKSRFPQVFGPDGGDGSLIKYLKELEEHQGPLHPGGGIIIILGIMRNPVLRLFCESHGVEIPDPDELYEHLGGD